MIEHVILGASGGIGGALVAAFTAKYGAAHVAGLSRRDDGFDLSDETSILAAAERFPAGSLKSVIVASGILAPDGVGPEKSVRHLSADVMAQVFMVNTIGPAIVGRAFGPKMVRKGPSVFAALSARVGSISDNRLGGWYSYRASKAALNQIIRTLAIEVARTSPERAVIGLHPGTVDTGLSKPHQKGVPDDKLFTPAYSAGRLLEVIEKARDGHQTGDLASMTGRCFDFAGLAIDP